MTLPPRGVAAPEANGIRVPFHWVGGEILVTKTEQTLFNQCRWLKADRP